MRANLFMTTLIAGTMFAGAALADKWAWRMNREVRERAEHRADRLTERVNPGVDEDFAGSLPVTTRRNVLPGASQTRVLRNDASQHARVAKEMETRGNPGPDGFEMPSAATTVQTRTVQKARAQLEKVKDPIKNAELEARHNPDPFGQIEGGAVNAVTKENAEKAREEQRKKELEEQRLTAAKLREALKKAVEEACRADASCQF